MSWASLLKNSVDNVSSNVKIVTSVAEDKSHVHESKIVEDVAAVAKKDDTEEVIELQDLDADKMLILEQNVFSVNTLDYAHPSGLINHRNDCFLISVIQSLRAIPYFQKFLHEISLYKLGPFLSELQQFAKEYDDNLTPKFGNLRAKLAIGDQQEDAHEMLIMAIDAWHNEIVSLLSQSACSISGTFEDDDEWREIGSKNKTIKLQSNLVFEHNSIFTKLFGGRLKLLLTRNNSKSVSYQPYFSLSLPITDSKITSIAHAVDAFTAPVQLESGKGMLRQRTTVDEMPRILIIHLARFTFDVQGIVVKNNRFISFSPYLKVTDKHLRGQVSFQSAMRYKLDNEDENKQGLYTLYAVINHHGDSVDYGHYTAFTKYNDHWYNCNDNDVNVTSYNNVKKSQAYILLYSLNPESSPLILQ